MSAADRAYDHTRERILDGEYAQGRLIGEGEVSAAVGVSRTPVREAFLRLEAEGLLTSTQARRFWSSRSRRPTSRT